MSQTWPQTWPERPHVPYAVEAARRDCRFQSTSRFCTSRHSRQSATQLNASGCSQSNVICRGACTTATTATSTPLAMPGTTSPPRLAASPRCVPSPGSKSSSRRRSRLKRNGIIGPRVECVLDFQSGFRRRGADHPDDGDTIGERAATPARSRQRASAAQSSTTARVRHWQRPAARVSLVSSADDCFTRNPCFAIHLSLRCTPCGARLGGETSMSRVTEELTHAANRFGAIVCRARLKLQGSPVFHVGLQS